MDKICVLLSSYNGEIYIKEQIDSIFKQEDVDVTLYVRDDCSSDKTLEILNDIQKEHDKKMFIMRDLNVGFCKSFFLLLKNAPDDFDYYAFADQDDVWFPQKLHKCLGMLQNKDVPEVSFCGCLLTDERLNVLKRGDSSPHLYDKYYNTIRNYAQGCSMVFNSKARELCLKGDANTLEYHDHWLLTICSYLGSVYYVDEPLFNYRQHSNNQIGSVSGFRSDIKHKIKILKKKTHHVETNAKQMLSCFNDLLNEEDKAYLTAIATYRASFKNKMRFIRNKTIKMHAYEHKGWLIKAAIFSKL